MKFLTLGLVILIMVSLLTVDAHAQASGKWVKLASFPEPAEEVYGAAAGGKMYVMGGLAPGWKPRGLVYEYDPTRNKWTKKKPMALFSHHVAVIELNGKIYAFGGFIPPQSGPPAWVPMDNAWEYDPATDSWKALAPMPTKRGSPVAAVVGGKIYVIGGRTGAAFISVATNTNIVEEYDPATDSWGPSKARMPSARSAVASGTYKDRIYVAGGEFQDDRMMAAFRALEAYHPATNSWATFPRMPVPRHGLAGAVIGNRLHLVSGEVQSAGIEGMHLQSDSHDAFEFSER
jgi:N-acetylneuraminic acid mutarotase